MSAEIKEATGFTAQLVPGRGGIFEVSCDGEIIFSKSNAGRFPAVGEITQII